MEKKIRQEAARWKLEVCGTLLFSLLSRRSLSLGCHPTSSSAEEQPITTNAHTRTHKLRAGRFL
jgi:hypothetical protein